MGQGKSKSSRRRAIDAQQILPDAPDDVGRCAIDTQQILPDAPDDVRGRAIDTQQILSDVPDDVGGRAMDSQQILPKVPDNLRFRVLIIGRANAGKTSILQRVCDTTESPEIYRLGPRGKRERVRCHSWWPLRFHHLVRFNSRHHKRLGILIFLLVTADHEDPACSVACTTLRTKSFSRIMRDMSSTTLVGSRQAVKMS
jgi:hypothetical protein